MAKQEKQRPAGHVRERRPGRWELRIKTGRDPLDSEKWLVSTKTVDALDEHEARVKLRDWIAELGVDDDSETMTFRDLLERWYAFASPRMVPAGQKETRRIVDTVLEPLHSTKLSTLVGRSGTAILDEFYAALRERGGKCRRRAKCETSPCRHGVTCTLDGKCSRLPCEHGGGAPLADGTVVRVNAVVHAALEQASKWYGTRNPATGAYDGEPDPEEVDPPKPDEVARLFKLAEQVDPELVVFLIIAATTGQRKGRVLALQWEDVDFATGVVTFSHVLSLGPNGPERVKIKRRRNNKKGKKVEVPLDPALLAILAAQYERCRARAELAGAELRRDSYVFSGEPLGERAWHPRTIDRHFDTVRRGAGIPRTTLHHLRHFVVSYLVASGVDEAVRNALVGHALGSATAKKVYEHALTENKRAATGILARLVGLVDDDAPAPEPEPVEVELVAETDEDAKVIPFRPRKKVS